MTAAVTEGTGTLDATSGDLHDANSDGHDVSFNYSGNAATIEFTLSGGCYLHGLKVVTDTSIQKQDLRGSKVYVGKDYEYKTINDALNAILVTPTKEEERITIVLTPGELYREQVHLTVPYISLVTEYKEGNYIPTEEQYATVTWYYGFGYYYDSMGSDGYYSATAVGDGESNATAEKAGSTWGSTFFVDADNFCADRVYFENSYNKYVTDEEKTDITGFCKTQLSSSATSDNFMKRVTDTSYDPKKSTNKERANALSVKGDKAIFSNCKISSSQDTLGYNGVLTNRTFFDNCTIEGNVDYICGGGYMYFNMCTLNWIGYPDQNCQGIITAAKSSPYLFKYCRIGSVDNSGGKYSSSGKYGRPWDAKAKTYFVECDTNGLIDAEGWAEWSGTNNLSTCSYKEYGNYDSSVENYNNFYSTTETTDKTYMGIYNAIKDFNTYFVNGWDKFSSDNKIDVPIPVGAFEKVINSDNTSAYVIVGIEENICSEFDKIGVAFGSTLEKAIAADNKYVVTGNVVSKGIVIKENDTVLKEYDYEDTYAQLYAAAKLQAPDNSKLPEDWCAVSFVEKDGERIYGTNITSKF